MAQKVAFFAPVRYENLGRMQSHMATGDEEAFASQKQGFQGDLPSFVFLGLWFSSSHLTWNGYVVVCGQHLTSRELATCPWHCGHQGELSGPLANSEPRGSCHSAAARHDVMNVMTSLQAAEKDTAQFAHLPLVDGSTSQRGPSEAHERRRGCSAAVRDAPTNLTSISIASSSSPISKAFVTVFRPAGLPEEPNPQRWQDLDRR